MNLSRISPFVAAAALVLAARTCGGQDYEVAFSTYLGGKGGEDTARAVAVDGDGNIYVAGGTKSPDFPTTPGAFSRNYTGGGKSVGARGPMDAFVTKLDPSGRIVWSTLLGGPNYDRAYTVRVDKQGFVYVGGRAGEGFPTTPDTVQPQFEGDSSGMGAYGKQDGFLVKLAPDGSRIVWSTYFGTPCGAIIRDFDIDPDGNVYLTMIGVKEPCRHITRGAFEERPPGGIEGIVAKVSADARRVIWCSYLGGSGPDGAPSIRVDATGHAYLAGTTSSADFSVTPGAYQRQLRGSQDAFVAKFKADGSGLEYATLLGGSAEDCSAGKHGLAIDLRGRAFIMGETFSDDFPATPQAFQRRYAGGSTGDWRHKNDRFVAIISADGARLEAATYLGGGAADGAEGIEVDSDGRVYLAGMTYSTDFPTTPNAPQRRFAGADRPHGPLWGGGDGTAVILSPDLQRLIFSTYMGGSGEDLFRACALTPRGELVLVGSSTSTDWPTTRDALQTAPAGGPDEVIVVKFRPVAQPPAEKKRVQDP